MQIDVRLKSVFNAKLSALNVVVKVPVPKYTGGLVPAPGRWHAVSPPGLIPPPCLPVHPGRAEFVTNAGRVKFDPAKNELRWKIKKLPGAMDVHMVAELGMVDTLKGAKPWNRPPIQMEFQIPSFNASGLRVQYLKVWEKMGYNTERWVRKVTRSGEVNVRLGGGQGTPYTAGENAL